jgi:hypothetical protein
LSPRHREDIVGFLPEEARNSGEPMCQTVQMVYRRIARLLAIAAAATLLGAQQSDPAVTDVQNAFRFIDAAVAKHDLGAFANALADRFTFLGINGDLIDRNAAIEMQKAGKLLAGTPNEIVKTQVYGDTAIVTYKTKVPLNGGATLMGTRIFLKQGGVWKWTYSQGSIVTPFAPK